MTHQERFNRDYITSAEIQRRLGVSRTAIFHRRKKGVFPEEIVVEGMNLVLWKRDEMEDHIQFWKRQIDMRTATK